MWHLIAERTCVFVDYRSSAVIFASSASKQGGSAKAVDYEGSACIIVLFIILHL